MSDLSLHPRTKLLIEVFKKRPGHGVLVGGSNSYESELVAQYLIEKTLNQRFDTLLSRGMMTLIKPDKNGVIRLKALKQISSYLSKKTTNPNTYERAVLIYKSDRMTLEAQNQFLKTLEEPVGGILYCLVTDNVNSLIRTIRSRLQIVEVLPMGYSDFKDELLAAGITNDEDILKRYILSRGYANFAKNSDIDEILDSAIIKQIFSETLYGATLKFRSKLKDRKSVNELITNLGIMAEYGVSRSAHQNDKKQMNYWLRVNDAIEQAKAAIESNGSLKLHTDKLLLAIHSQT